MAEGGKQNDATPQKYQTHRRGYALFFNRLLDQERLLSTLHQVVAAEGIDHVLFETFEYITLSRHIGKVAAPYSLIIHDTNFNTQHRSPVAAAYKTFVRHLVRRVVIGACGSFVHGVGMRDNLAEVLNLEVPPEVLPYGSEPPPATLMGRMSARALLNIETDGPLLLAFGTLRDDKNFSLVFQALKHAPNWKLLIAGPESSLTYKLLRRQAEDVDLSSRIIMRPGYIASDLHEAYFRAADAVTAIYDSRIRHESGTAQLARTYLTPVVAGGPPDLRQYIEKEGVGWFADKPDPSVLGEILQEIEVLDNESRAGLENRILQSATARSWPVVANQILRQVRRS